MMRSKAGVVLRESRVGGGYQRLEWQAGAEHVLDEGRRRDEVFELEIEDALEPLHGQRAQLGQCPQHAAEVRRPAAARAVGHVCTKASDDLHLQLLHSMWFFQPVSLCNNNMIN